MLEDPLSGTQTWPMSRLNTTFAARTVKTSSSRQLYDAMQSARDYIDQTQEMTDLHTQHTRSLIQNLYDELEKRKTTESVLRRRSKQSTSQALGMIRESVEVDGRLRDEPHFESMIFSDVGRKLSMRQTQFSDPEGGVDCGMQESGEEEIDLSDIYSNLDPYYIRAIPHIAMVTCTIVYLCAGTVIFQKIDPDLAKKPFHEVLLFAFSLISTIGWGNLTANYHCSRIFSMLYTMIGIPIAYSTMANIGKIFSELYTVDWLYFTAVVRGKKPTTKAKRIPDRMSIKLCLNLIFVHLFIGLILFSGVIQQLEIVESVYFISISVQTIGLGDLKPAPKSWIDTIVLIIYLTFGIIILSAFFLNISYYFQLFYYVYLTEWLHNAYEWIRGRRNKVTDNQISSNPVCK